LGEKENYLQVYSCKNECIKKVGENVEFKGYIQAIKKLMNQGTAAIVTSSGFSIIEVNVEENSWSYSIYSGDVECYSKSAPPAFGPVTVPKAAVTKVAVARRARNSFVFIRK